MKNIKHVLLVTGVVMCGLINVGTVYGAQPPEFHSCLNPQGTQKVKYDSGLHGIVGEEYLFQGKDIVYTLSDNAQLQCFCPEDGNGIQTDWWKASALTADEIVSYQNQGWVLITDGSKWGLSSDPYLARNSRYSCKTNSTPTPTPTPGGIGGGSSTTVTQVLALASTGNAAFIYALAGSGIIFVLAGILLQMKLKK